MLIFFVQAEDGIRDGHVTGVQTCALPILSWRGRTIRPNEREYAVRLQYRVGDEGEFNDVTGQDGGVIEYRRSTTEGHQQSFGPITLPADAEGQDYVQLRWKYHYTGQVESGDRKSV